MIGINMIGISMIGISLIGIGIDISIRINSTIIEVNTWSGIGRITTKRGSHIGIWMWATETINSIPIRKVIYTVGISITIIGISIGIGIEHNLLMLISIGCLVRTGLSGYVIDNGVTTYCF